jgi:CRP-like cAMP-binding protein
MGPLDALAASKDLSKASRASREHLSEAMVRVHFEANSLIFREGDPPGPLYLLERGHVWLAMTRPDGSAHFVADMGPGTLIGDMTGVLHCPRTVTATAVTRVDAWQTDVETFRAVLRSDAPLAYELFRRAAELLVAKDIRTAQKMGQSTLARVVSVLVELGAEGAPIRLSHAELGVMVGRAGRACRGPGGPAGGRRDRDGAQGRRDRRRRATPERCHGGVAAVRQHRVTPPDRHSMSGLRVSGPIVCAAIWKT